MNADFMRPEIGQCTGVSIRGNHFRSSVATQDPARLRCSPSVATWMKSTARPERHSHSSVWSRGRTGLLHWTMRVSPQSSEVEKWAR